MPERPHLGLTCLAASVLIVGLIGRVSASEVDEMNEYARRFLRPGYTIVDLATGRGGGEVTYLLVDSYHHAVDLSKTWQGSGDPSWQVNHGLMVALRGCRLGDRHPGHLGMLLTALLDGPHSTAGLLTSRSYSSRKTPSGTIWTIQVRRRDEKFRDLGPLCSYEVMLSQQGEIAELRRVSAETDSPNPSAKLPESGRLKSKAWWHFW